MRDEEKRERICRELSGKESLEFGKLQERTGIPGENRDPGLHSEVPVGGNDQGGTGRAMWLPEREETLPSGKTGKPPCL